MKISWAYHKEFADVGEKKGCLLIPRIIAASHASQKLLWLLVDEGTHSTKAIDQ